MSFGSLKSWLWLISTVVIAGLLTGCSGGERPGDPRRGEELYRMQTIGSTQAPGCVVCHSLESEVVKVGPSHAGIAARASTILQSPDYGGEAKTVEGYIRESILSPDVYVAEGFPSGLMYQDYGELLSEQDLADLVAFIMENQ